MQSKGDLENTFKEIDNKGYKAYKEIQNNWYDYNNYQIGIPYVQGDPFANPSSVFIRINQRTVMFPDWMQKNNIRKQAIEDFLTRAVAHSINKHVKGNRGSGKSGRINITQTGQEVIERTSVEFYQDYIEVRINVGLPAKGRRVMGYQACKIFFEELPKIIEDSLYYRCYQPEKIEKHVLVTEDQHILRKQLSNEGLVAFIANGSVLPRKSGVDDRPLTGNGVVNFQSPLEYETKFELPYQGEIRGMGIKEGITLIVGGGYHGKSTLLNAVEHGVYNHIPGDGREYVVTRSDAFKIRAEDGRKITRVDISPFINNLPQGVTTKDFSTDNASGSTSQAANIIEALELGSKLLLIDEDTCATNFMIRDARMQKLVSNKKEPITPFIDKVKPLYQDYQVSTILVVGGTGDYFDVADQVIMMDEYVPKAVTRIIKQIARDIPSKRENTYDNTFGSIRRRYPDPDSINPWIRNRIKVKNRGIDKIQFGYEDIDLSNIEQIINQEQTRAIGDIIVYGIKEGLINNKRTLLEALELIYKKINEKGLKVISPFNNPENSYVKPRLLEVGAAINRLRSLKIDKLE